MLPPDSAFAEAVALRYYIEAVATELGVETTAAWHEYGPPSSAYIALPHRPPDNPEQFLMLQWSSDDGWSLAIEPTGAETPVVVAAWPDDPHPPPQALAAAVRRQLSTSPDLAHHPSEDEPCVL
ncbi:DUF6292 family protein [Actinophytocola sp. KF-1]